MTDEPESRGRIIQAVATPGFYNTEIFLRGMAFECACPRCGKMHKVEFTDPPFDSDQAGKEYNIGVSCLCPGDFNDYCDFHVRGHVDFSATLTLTHPLEAEATS